MFCCLILISDDLFPGDSVKEFGQTLEVVGRKNRTMSLSNVDILISPCDPDQDPTNTCPESPDPVSEEKDGGYVEKTKLEATVSYPLERSKVTQYLPSPISNMKTMSGDVCSPEHQQASTSPSMPHPIGETNDEVKEEREGAAESSHGNRGEEPTGDCEQLLLEEDRLYPTLRSKSLNINPRKSKSKMMETPRSAGSVADLVSEFSGGGGTQSTPASRQSDC